VADEVAVWITEQAIEIFGANDFTHHPVERWHRVDKIFTIVDGT
jgi:alkylation response protein AidB-like acyl-CoA dehydrogenase